MRWVVGSAPHGGWHHQFFYEYLTRLLYKEYDSLHLFVLGARYSRSVVRTSAFGAMGRWIDPPWRMASPNISRLLYKEYESLHLILLGARCSSSVLRMSAHGAMDQSFMVDPLSYFSFQPVFHDRCNKGRGMCHPVCGMVHIKEPLLLIGKSSTCRGGSGFPLSLRRKEMFYLTMHSTHFIYGYMASDIWKRTTQIAREETRCRHRYQTNIFNKATDTKLKISIPPPIPNSKF